MTDSKVRRRPCSTAGRRALVAGILVLVCGCSSRIDPLTPQEQSKQIAEDRKQLFADQEPVSGPLTLEDVMARALKYNLDIRVAALEQAVEDVRNDSSFLSLLPRFSGTASGHERSNQSAALSRNTSNNFLSLLPATSEDRGVAAGDISASWSLLDFGVSYYEARSQADKTLIAREQRRRAAEQVVGRVRAVFWQAALSERVLPKVDEALDEARAALTAARQVEDQKLRNPLDSLHYQRELLDIIRDLEGTQETLATAKATLASLMNLPPGQDFKLALPPSFDHDVPNVTYSVEQMELIALYNRPEVRAATYQGRISVHDTRAAVLKLLPNPGLDANLDWNSNSYFINKAWATAGAQVAWNLMNIVAAPQVMRLMQTQQELADEQRLAASMAALTQVNVAYHAYLRSVSLYQDASIASDVDRRIAENIAAATAVGNSGNLDRIRTKASAIASELACDRAYGEMQNTVAELYMSLGVDPIGELKQTDVAGVSAALREVDQQWQAGRISPAVWPVEMAKPAAAAK